MLNKFIQMTMRVAKQCYENRHKELRSSLSKSLLYLESILF